MRAVVRETRHAGSAYAEVLVAGRTPVRPTGDRYCRTNASTQLCAENACAHQPGPSRVHRQCTQQRLSTVWRAAKATTGLRTNLAEVRRRRRRSTATSGRPSPTSGSSPSPTNRAVLRPCPDTSRDSAFVAILSTQMLHHLFSNSPYCGHASAQNIRFYDRLHSSRDG